MAERADLVVKNGKIVSSQGIIEGGVAIKDGKFTAVGKDSALPDGHKVIDAAGKHTGNVDGRHGCLWGVMVTAEEARG